MAQRIIAISTDVCAPFLAGGVHKAVENALAIGAESFALFLKSQRQWKYKPLDPEVAKKFKEALKVGYIVPTTYTRNIRTGTT